MHSWSWGAIGAAGFFCNPALKTIKKLNLHSVLRGWLIKSDFHRLTLQWYSKYLQATILNRFTAHTQSLACLNESEDFAFLL